MSQTESCEVLATLFHLSKRIRTATNPAEIKFVLVNETQTLLPYRQAAFYSDKRGVESISGVSNFDQHAPYIQWLSQWFAKTPKNASSRSMSLNLSSLADDSWSEWLPPHLLIVRTNLEPAAENSYLMLAREEKFSQEEIAIIEEWAEVWHEHFQQYDKNTWLDRLTRLKKRSKTLSFRVITIAALVGISLIPVKLSVLAPAELIALNPSMIRAPMDGVIDQIHIEPNQRVTANQALLEFDRVNLQSRLNVAKQTLETSKAEYRQQAQNALFERDSKAKLAVLRSQIEEKELEVQYLESLNQRSLVTSPSDGIALINDTNEWLGKPVVTGEKLLMIADETQSQVEAWLSPSDVIEFPENAKVTLFLSANPIEPVNAKLSYLSHQAELQADSTYAYRLRAQIDLQQYPNLRIGQKGTARIDGQTVTLIYWVFRRPMAAIRGWLGI